MENKQVTVRSSGKATVTVKNAQKATVIVKGERVVGGNIETYQGDYEVEPLVSQSVVLETEGKRMAQNVTVHEIPIYRTSNEDGTTIYIGRK